MIVGKVGQESVDNEFNLLKVLKITDMIRIELSKFGLEIMKNALPQPLQQMMDAHGGKKTHRYPTQAKNTPTFKNIKVTSLTKLPM